MIKSSFDTFLTSVRNVREFGLFDGLRKYWVICVLSLLVLASITSLIIFVTNPFSNNIQKSNTVKANQHKYVSDIYIDLSGSIRRPDVYKITSTTRLYELVDLAGGLTEEADHEFIMRNINFAQALSDGQKVYFPSKKEVLDKVFVENQKILSQRSSSTQSGSEDRVVTPVSINTSSADEIESLPGIGEVTREKIIKGRPYKSLDDLILRGIVNQGVFNKIQDSIAL